MYAFSQECQYVHPRTHPPSWSFKNIHRTTNKNALSASSFMKKRAKCEFVYDRPQLRPKKYDLEKAHTHQSGILSPKLTRWNKKEYIQSHTILSKAHAHTSTTLVLHKRRRKCSTHVRLCSFIFVLLFPLIHASRHTKKTTHTSFYLVYKNPDVAQLLFSYINNLCI